MSTDRFSTGRNENSERTERNTASRRTNGTNMSTRMPSRRFTPRSASFSRSTPGFTTPTTTNSSTETTSNDLTSSSRVDEMPEILRNLLSTSSSPSRLQELLERHRQTRPPKYVHEERPVPGEVPREYIEICDTRTGEIFPFPKGRFGRFKKGLKKIINYYKYRGKHAFCSHYAIFTIRRLTTEERNRFLSNIRKYRAVNNLDLHYVLFVSIVRDHDSGTPLFYVYNLVLFCNQQRFPKFDRILDWWPQKDDTVVGHNRGLKKEKVKSVRALIDSLQPYYGDSFEYFDLVKNRIRSFFTSYIMPVFRLNRERFEQVVQRLGYHFWKYFKGFRLGDHSLYIWSRNRWRPLLEFERRYIALDPEPLAS